MNSKAALHVEVVSLIFMEEISHDWMAWRVIVTVEALRRCHNICLSRFLLGTVSERLGKPT